MAKQLPRVAIVCLLGALGGCELFANVPAYTSSGDGGADAMIDGMLECVTSEQCTAPEVCFMSECRRCDSDAHCGPAIENVCLSDATCAEKSRIAYASPNGSGTVCTVQTPCAITQAFTMAAGSAAIDIVKLLPGNYPRGELISIGAETVILAGEGATLTATAAVAMFRVTTGTFTIIGAELVGMQQYNALCGGIPGQLGTLKLFRAVTRGGAIGVGGTMCNIDVTRSTVRLNTDVGVYVSGGTARLINSVVMGNGTNAAAQGGVQFLSLTNARVEMSTIVGNTSMDDGYAGGLTCTGSTNVVTTSISWGNSVGTALGPLDTECNVDYSIVEPAYTAGPRNVRMDPMFEAVGNFHIQGTSPARGKGDPALTVGVDFDNDPRPQGGDAAFDCGADEVP